MRRAACARPERRGRRAQVPPGGASARAAPQGSAPRPGPLLLMRSFFFSFRVSSYFRLNGSPSADGAAPGGAGGARAVVSAPSLLCCSARARAAEHTRRKSALMALPPGARTGHATHGCAPAAMTAPGTSRGATVGARSELRQSCFILMCLNSIFAFRHAGAGAAARSSGRRSGYSSSTRRAAGASSAPRPPPPRRSP